MEFLESRIGAFDLFVDAGGVVEELLDDMGSYPEFGQVGGDGAAQVVYLRRLASCF
jgi:hypothetical protein